MTWIQTAHGRRFDFVGFVDDDAICIEDIAHALSNICRFNGHTRCFYSVAQHSVVVSDHVPDTLKFEGLMHDAHEAYIGDITSPLKQLINSETRIGVCLSQIECRVRVRFGLPKKMSQAVKVADQRALVTEARDLFFNQPIDDWVSKYPEPFEHEIIPLGPEAACELFLRRFDELLRLTEAIA